MRRQRSLAAHRRSLQDPEEPACPQESSPPLHAPFPLNRSHCKIQLHRLHTSCQQVHPVLSLEPLVVQILLLHLI